MRDGRTILAWQMAALSRQKKLPKLDALLKCESFSGVEDKMKNLFATHSATKRR
jgi:hypothetical protein